MPDAVDEIDGLEVVTRAVSVNVAARAEAVVLEEHEREAPIAFADELAATAAVRAARRRALGPVQPRNAAALDAETRGGHERLEAAIGHCLLRLEERLGPRVRGAGQVEPQRHLALAECVRLPLAEAQLPLGDRSVATAALGSAARGRFDDVCHA